MSHLPITLIAYFLNSVSVLVDKLMLTKHIGNPLTYIFYISCFSLIVLPLLPFTNIPGLNVFIQASISTLLWTSGAYFMFHGLKVGVASRVIPIIGTLIPIILLVSAVFSQSITQNQILAVLVLVFGLILLTLPNWKGEIKISELIFEVLSALFFAVSYLVLKEAYNQEQFLTVLVWSRLILVPVTLLVILIPFTRHIIKTQKDSGGGFKLRSKTGALFLLGQASGGISELLLTFSISLATPALVNSLQGSQYGFLFIFSLILAKKYPEVFKEKNNLWSLIGKFLGILAIAAGLFILAFSE